MFEDFDEQEFEELYREMRFAAGKPFVTLKEAAKLTGNSYLTIWRHVQFGTLKASKPAGQYRISVRNLTKWMFRKSA